MTRPTPVPGPSRRELLGLVPATLALATVTGLPAFVLAQETAAPAAAASRSFSFDILTQQMRDKAARPHEVPPQPESFLTGLTYDDYNRIAYSPDRAKWDEKGSLFRVHAFHMGWLFKEPVRIYEVTGDQATEMVFTTGDFEYREGLADKVPDNADLPGVAGFRLHFPLNRADVLDELVAFVGASYFRALGKGNAYGLSARGLAVNTGLSGAEEFPRFSAFYLEKAVPGAQTVTLHAALESPSVTGAYRFVITPGIETVMDVTARLFFRSDVEQLGIAPLTSMFLYAENNRDGYDDYRPQVHDSNGLAIRTAAGDRQWRALNNPPHLASSYFGMENPRAFGLHQRDRDFASFQDAGARYERRPSIDVEPIGDWGKGSVRLVEIPSDLEVNDNIVAFWVPEGEVKAGESREFAYRLHWGFLPPGDDLAYVLDTRAGHGGVSGIENDPTHRKFVVDFTGGMIANLPDAAEIEAVVSISNGEIITQALSKVEGTGIWRLVLDVAATDTAPVELVAHLAGYNRKLTETWLSQWVKK